ncbi:MAG: hypothetical protein SF182_29795 [Deltaproteobacteria bacterium]|nr:hypothetical protein [Deltaproteobacteria bacterium]
MAALVHRAVLIALIGTVACGTHPPTQPEPASSFAPRNVALQREAPVGQLVSWASGAYVFVVSYDEARSWTKGSLGRMARQAGIGAILEAYVNDPEIDVLSLNEAIGNDPQRTTAVMLLMARSLESGNASIIDAERGFVVGSVNVVPFSERTHAGRRFETRDGRRVLEVIDVVYRRAGGILL